MTDVDSKCYRLIQELYPICRSITGDGVRQTLSIINRHTPIQTKEVPSGTQVFDWKVPPEWNIKDAYIQDLNGKKIVNFKKSNLHVVSYSIPIRKKISLSELKNHLYTIPEQPDWIPYRTTYYKENWGFCLSHNQFKSMHDDFYEICIDSSLEHGSLTYGELLIPGKTKEEILISTHICHPSLCNDNLSGISVATFLSKYLLSNTNRYSYRFLFIPGTIGAITWLAINKDHVDQIKHGLVLSGLGDDGKLHYKKSRQGAAGIDQAAEYAIKKLPNNALIKPFHPYGYDERQFCSPGFNLPVGRLSRTPFGEYPEYHTSADNLDFVNAKKLESSLDFLIFLLNILEINYYYKNLIPYCEPQLGKRGLYDLDLENINALLWLLNQSDGQMSLLDIAKISNIKIQDLNYFANILEQKSLLKRLKI